MEQVEEVLAEGNKLGEGLLDNPAGEPRCWVNLEGLIPAADH